ncbi:hypothetical protein BH09ACT6_BH09ACT6_21490 [soil metagenome]
MFPRIASAVVVVAVAAALALVGWPQVFGLEHTIGFAQLVAFRALFVVGATPATLALIIVIAALRRRHPAIVALLVIVALFGVANTGLLAVRGWSPSPASTPASTPAAAPSNSPRGTTITVLTWNTLGGAVDAQTIAQLALAVKADVITLPETTEATATEVTALLAAAGTPMWSHTVSLDESTGTRSTSLLISTALGAYEPTDEFGNTSRLPSVVARPVKGVGPVIAAVHPVAPVPGEMSNWRRDLDWISTLCRTPNLVVGGDFNATLDHVTSLQQCSDTALAAHTAAVGTWPTSLPPFLSAPIDHVMHTSSWATVSARVIDSEDAAGSDHRPFVAVLAPVPRPHPHPHRPHRPHRPHPESRRPDASETMEYG